LSSLALTSKKHQMHPEATCWQDLHSLTYLHTCSVLMSSLPFTSYLKSHKCELPKDTFLVHSSHNFTRS
jgi:hypothetical protein